MAWGWVHHDAIFLSGELSIHIIHSHILWNLSAKLMSLYVLLTLHVVLWICEKSTDSVSVITFVAHLGCLQTSALLHSLPRNISCCQCSRLQQGMNVEVHSCVYLVPQAKQSLSQLSLMGTVLLKTINVWMHLHQVRQNGCVAI